MNIQEFYADFTSKVKGKKIVTQEGGVDWYVIPNGNYDDAGKFEVDLYKEAERTSLGPFYRLVDTTSLYIVDGLESEWKFFDGEE